MSFVKIQQNKTVQTAYLGLNIHRAEVDYPLLIINLIVFLKNRRDFLNAERSKISNQVLNICCRINPGRENLKNSSNALLNTTSPFSGLGVSCNYDN